MKDKPILKINTNTICICMLYILGLMCVCKFGGTITHLALAILMVVIGLTGYYYVLWPLVVFLNDGLGTVYAGRISYIWILVALYIIRWFSYPSTQTRHIGKNTFYKICLLGIWIMYTLLFQPNELQDFLLKTVPYLLGFLVVFYDINRKAFTVEDICLHMVFAVCVLAIASVVFQQYFIDESYVIRYGLLGTGRGDPNYSANKIVLAMVILTVSNKLKWLYKTPILVILLIALLRTASMSAILIAICLLFFYYFVNHSIEGKLAKFVFVISILFGGIFVLYLTGNEIVISAIDTLQYRIDILLGKTYVAGTEGGSGRSALIEKFIRYTFDQQNVVRMAFGGNTLPLEGFYSHNTVIDFLVRYGIIGTVILIIICIKSVWDSFKNKNNLMLMMKLSVLLFSLTISVYSGESAALWFVFMILFCDYDGNNRYKWERISINQGGDYLE